MTFYTFKETIEYFEKILKSEAPKEDIESGEVELTVDQFQLLLTKGKSEGDLKMEIDLGLFFHPPRENRLHELATSNFFGINTGGCTLQLDESGVALTLRCNTTASTPPQENWEWLHRILSVAQEWNKVVNMWEEFLPLIKEENHGSKSRGNPT